MKKILMLNAGLLFFSALNAQEPRNLVVNRAITADRTADSIRQLLIKKDTVIKKPSTKKPYREPAKKPAEKTAAKRND